MEMADELLWLLLLGSKCHHHSGGFWTPTWSVQSLPLAQTPPRAASKGPKRHSKHHQYGPWPLPEPVYREH